MLERFRINPLFLFLVLGIAFMWLAFPGIRKELFGSQHYSSSTLSVEDQVNYPEQGFAYYGDIKLYNPNLQLLYSLNGGKSFYEAPEEGLSLDDLKNDPIIYRNTSIRWRHPKGEFPELTSVVLKVRDESKMIESAPKTLTYFDPGITEYPIVNITVNEDDLFDWRQGIMIYGESSANDDGFQKDWWYRSANFASRGSDWSRKAVFQIFSNNTYFDWNENYNCLMKISGNATRYFPQKSLKFKLVDENGKSIKEYAPFTSKDGSKKKMESLLLRQSGNDNGKTMFADLLMHKLAYGSNVIVQQGFPVSVFINGNYWGIYNFRERIDRRFIAENEDVKKNKVTILYCEVYGDRTILKSGSEEEKQRFDALISELPEKMEDEEAYKSVKDVISIKSFIDYIIFETFYANQDWLYNNTTWYKADDKKWKWVLNDLDYSLAYPGNGNVNANLFDRLLTRNSITGQLFSSLITYPKFKERFKERVTEITDTRLSEETINLTFQKLRDTYRKEIDNQIRRWRFIDSYEQWEKDCEKNVTFLLERRTIYLNQVQEL